jgi:F-type H+-transporting ATPase subunit epsilon
MHLEIVTPDKKIYSGEVKLVNAPGSEGSFEILNNHTALISTLGKGTVKVIESNGTEKLFEVDKGVIEVNNNNVILLAEKI